LDSITELVGIVKQLTEIWSLIRATRTTVLDQGSGSDRPRFHAGLNRATSHAADHVTIKRAITAVSRYSIWP